MRIEVADDIEAPVERVFAVLTDVARWPERIPAIRSVEVLSAGPLREGSRFRETRFMYGREASEEMQVAEFDPPHAFVLTAENHGARYVVRHLLSRRPDGCRLLVEFSAEPVSLAARVMAPLAWLLRGGLERQLAADLAGVRRAAEGDQAR